MFSTKLIGASGAVIIVAPITNEDSCESPLIFVAMTLTNTLASFDKEKGAEVNTSRGIMH